MTSTTLPPRTDVDPTSAPAVPRRIVTRGDLGDTVYRWVARGAGLVVLLIMGGVGLFLAIRGGQALKQAGFSFLTTSAWSPENGTFGVAAVLTDGVFIAIVAVCVSLPLSLGTSLFISEIAPVRLKRALISAVDLMAAVPSVVFGLFGVFLFQEQAIGFARWVGTWLGFIPMLAIPDTDLRDPLLSPSTFTGSIFVAGVVVGVMTTPIQTAIMREVFSQAPVGEREGAYALGATRWGVVRAVVLPFGRGGIIGGTMLGLGRALGETIAILMIISPIFTIQPHWTETGGNSVSTLIALRFGDASEFGLSALMAAGLALFVLTLVVNFTASTIVARSRSGAETG
ncbi:phosphate ABC transporter permease subunit PstC [Jatrophihabitans sp. YIM 134969]